MVSTTLENLKEMNNYHYSHHFAIIKSRSDKLLNRLITPSEIEAVVKLLPNKIAQGQMTLVQTSTRL